MAEYHIRASQWYENNGLMLEAFHHAAAANDVERAVRLMESKGMPLHLRGAAATILNWLESLPTTVLDAQPALWWKHASVLLASANNWRGRETPSDRSSFGCRSSARRRAGRQDPEPDRTNCRARASLALTQHQAETIFVQSRRALEYLHPDNLPYRSELPEMGYAYYLQGDRAAAGRAYAEAYLSPRRPGILSTPYWLQPAWARYRNWRTSFTWRPRPTSVF